MKMPNSPSTQNYSIIQNMFPIQTLCGIHNFCYDFSGKNFYQMHQKYVWYFHIICNTEELRVK